MFCNNCGNQLDDGVLFCDKCGARTDGSKEGPVAIGTTYAKGFSESSEKVLVDKIRKNLVDPAETILYKMGNGYIENLFMNKQIKTWTAVLTDKRVYFRGKLYEGPLDRFRLTAESRVINVDDITGTGFKYTSLSWIVLILDVLFAVISMGIIPSVVNNSSQLIVLMLIVMAIAVAAFVKIITSRTVLFYVHYAGGEICVNAMMVGLEACDDFQKQIIRAKDKEKGKI